MSYLSPLQKAIEKLKKEVWNAPITCIEVVNFSQAERILEEMEVDMLNEKEANIKIVKQEKPY